MSNNSDHPTSDATPTQLGGAARDRAPAEDPLVELARIVHRNKQPTAGSDRVGSADYFADLDRVDKRLAQSAPDVRVTESAPDEATPTQQSRPAHEVDEAPWSRISSQDNFESTAVDTSRRSASGSGPAFLISEPEPEVEPSEIESIESVSLNRSASLDLEQNLASELEDELIGAFRKSFEPVATPKEPATNLHSESAYEPSTPTGADIGSQEAFADERSHVDTRRTEPHSFVSPIVPAVNQMPDQLAETAAAEDESVFALSADEQRRRDDDDLFFGLNELDPPAAPVEPKPKAADTSSFDALFADLEFSPQQGTQVRAETEETDLVLGEPVRNTAAQAVDIDDMVWPAAAAAVADVADEDLPPPPEGYDLDAVAKAMQESDPTLDGSGVLPPHPQQEQAAIPGAERGQRKGLYAAAAILGVAVLGVGAFALFDGSSVEVPSGPPPVIAGLQEPLKIYPENAPQATDDTQASKLIYDRVGDVSDASRERLVLPEATQPAELPPAPDGASSADPLVPGGPKKVRTLVVRPDGTIISGQPNSTAAPVRAAEPTPAQPIAAVPAAGVPVATEPTVPAIAAPDPVSPTTPAIVTTTPAVVADVPTAVVPGVIPRKKPAVPVQVARAPQATEQRPSTPVNSGPLDLSNPNETTPPAVAQPDAAGSIQPGTYIVQVTSQRSAEDARATYQTLQQRYSSVLGGRNAVIVAANVDNRGTFYRARIPTASRNDAISLCESLKAAGGDCFVRRN